MASFPAVTMTTEGLNMIAKASSGNIEDRLIITKVKFGDGVSEGNIREYTDVISPKMEVTLAEWEDRGDGRFRYTFTYNNKGVKTGFYHREIGLFAKSGDNGGEKLIAYSNAGSYPGYIDDETKEIPYQRLMINIGVGDTDNVTGQVDVSNAVTIEILDEHNADENAHAKLIKKLFGSSEATLESVKEKVNDWAKEVCLPLSGGEMTGDITANNVYANNNVLVFNNVADMKASNKVKAGYTLKTLGFYEPNDGGGTNYVILDNIGEDEIDEASIITLQNGLYAKLLIQDIISVKQFGAKGDGETDDTSALQKVFDFVKKEAIGKKTGYEDLNSVGFVSLSIIFPKGFYYITNTITMYILGSIKANDAMIVASKEVSPAIIIEGVEAVGDVGVYDLCNTWKIEGLKLSCNNIFNLISKTIGIKFSENLKTSKWMTSFTDVLIRGFYYGVELGNNTYNNVFINCMFKNCICCFHIPEQLTNAFERNTFISCTFADSTSAFESHRPDGVCSLFACSLDYCIGETIIADNGAQFLLNGCWLEWNSETNKNYQIKITTGENNRDSLVIIFNSYILCQNKERLTVAPFYCDVKKSGSLKAGLVLENTRMAGINSDYLVDGSGQIFIKNITGYSQQNPRPDMTQKEVYTLYTVPFIPYGLRTDLNNYYSVNLNKEEGILSIQKTNNSISAENMPYFIIPIKDSETIRITAHIKGSNQLDGQRLLMYVGYGYIDSTGKLVSIYKQGTKDLTSQINQSVVEDNYIFFSDDLGYNECRFSEMCPYQLMAYFVLELGEVGINYKVSFKKLQLLHLFS